jgi:hypothetical protein
MQQALSADEIGEGVHDHNLKGIYNRSTVSLFGMSDIVRSVIWL